MYVRERFCVSCEYQEFSNACILVSFSGFLEEIDGTLTSVEGFCALS
jgi:hypothetical protein